MILKKRQTFIIKRKTQNFYLGLYRHVYSLKIYDMRQIQVSNRYYQQNLFLSEISKYTVSKHANLEELQLSNTGTFVEFIASNKLISPYTFRVLLLHRTTWTSSKFSLTTDTSPISGKYGRVRTIQLT